MSTRDLLALIAGAGKTVEQVAQALNVDSRVIVNIAKGYQPMPQAMVADFAGFLGVDQSEVEYACPAIAAGFLDLFALKNPQQLPFDATKIYQPGGTLFTTLQAGMLKTMQGGITLSGDVSGPSNSNTVDKWKNVALDIGTFVTPSDAAIPIFNNLASEWKALNVSQDASLGNNGALTVIGLQGRALVSTAPSTGQAIVWSGTQWTPGSIGPSTFTPGTAGQVLITNGTPVSAWTSLISVELTHGRFKAGTGTDYATTIGQLVGSEGTFGALYMQPAATTLSSATQWTIAGNVTNTYIGFPTGGVFHISQPGVGDWVTLSASAGMAWFNASSQGIANIEPVHGRGTFGGGGSDTLAVLGPTPSNETTLAGVWLLLHGIVPTASNTILSADGASAYINSISATGQINFVAGGANVFGSFDWNAKRFYAGGLGNTSPFLVDWATSLQTQVGSGTSQTSLLVGNFNTGAASVIIQGGTGGITWRDGATQTTRGSIDLAHGIATFGGAGSDMKGIIGPDIAAPTAAALVHLIGGATTPTGSNYSLYGDGNVTAVNCPGSTLMFQVATSSAIWLQSGILTNFLCDTFDWVESRTPLIMQDAHTSDAACKNFTIRAQYPFATATLTNRTPGSVVFDIGLPTNGSSVEAAFKFTRNAIEGGRVGLSASGQWSLWLGQSAGFTSANMAILSDASTFTYVNTTATGAFGIVSADATFLAYIPTSQNKWYFGGTTLAGSLVTFDWSASAAPTISFNEGSAGSLLINPRTSDAATSALTIKGSYPFATSTGTNRVPGNMIFDVGAPVNGLTGVANEAEFQWSRAGTVLQSLKFDNVNDIAICKLPNTAWEFVWIVGAGEIVLANNVFATGGGSAWWMSAQTTTVYFGGFVTATAPVQIDFTTSTTPTVRGGSAATSITFGSNKSGASSIFQGDAATTILTLTTFGEFATAVKLDNVSTPSTPSGGTTVYGNSGRQAAVSSNGHIFITAG